MEVLDSLKKQLVLLEAYPNPNEVTVVSDRATCNELTMRGYIRTIEGVPHILDRPIIVVSGEFGRPYLHAIPKNIFSYILIDTGMAMLDKLTKTVESMSAEKGGPDETI